MPDPADLVIRPELYMRDGRIIRSFADAIAFDPRPRDTSGRRCTPRGAASARAGSNRWGSAVSGWCFCKLGGWARAPAGSSGDGGSAGL